jgi:hypothetical protein
MAGSTTTPKGEIKIKAPETFDGKPEHVNRWLGSVKRYLDINSHIYDTDDKQVLFTLSYMQDGPAENWVEDFTEDATAIGTSGQAKGYGTFATLKNLIAADFGPANPEGTAMQSLMKLKQSDCDSLTDYISFFKLYAGRAGITEVNTFCQFFLGGMNPGLRRSVMNDELPMTNAGLIKKAIAKQANFEELKTLQSLYGGAPDRSKKNQSKKPRFNSNRDPNAMEVDRLSEQEKQRCYEKGLCFRCQEQGHRSRDCPKKTHGDDRKNSKGKQPVRRKTPDDEESKSKIEEIDEEDDEMEVGRMQQDF